MFFSFNLLLNYKKFGLWIFAIFLCIFKFYVKNFIKEGMDFAILQLSSPRSGIWIDKMDDVNNNRGK
ncbi:MAG: hypothetical protein CFE24_03290 [Flavobacterium sp. BFFFF2]|nr:MAG: hypothetical protein CFE24_03290 [Flavobacterium sp. BFFFF2]